MPNVTPEGLAESASNRIVEKSDWALPETLLKKGYGYRKFDCRRRTTGGGRDCRRRAVTVMHCESAVALQDVLHAIMSIQLGERISCAK